MPRISLIQIESLRSPRNPIWTELYRCTCPRGFRRFKRYGSSARLSRIWALLLYKCELHSSPGSPN